MYFISVLFKVLSQLIMLLSPPVKLIHTLWFHPCYSEFVTHSAVDNRFFCCYSVDWLLQTYCSCSNPSPTHQPRATNHFFVRKSPDISYIIFLSSSPSHSSPDHLTVSVLTFKVSSRLKLDFTQLFTLFMTYFVLFSWP